MAKIVTLWARVPEIDGLDLPPIYAAGYHLSTDEEYRALPVAAWNGLIEAVREGATENALMILGALSQDPLAGTVPS